MVRLRYFRVRLDAPFSALAREKRFDVTAKGPRLELLERARSDLVAQITVSRSRLTTQLDAQGTIVQVPIDTVTQWKFRLFNRSTGTYLVVLDPPRGLHLAHEILEAVSEGHRFYVEPLQIDLPLIRRHVAFFDGATLVSAKVKDFEVSAGVVGRLEASSKSGLLPEIAPFLADRFYRIDMLTYQVVHKMCLGLLCYSASGAIRVGDQLSEIAVPLFEDLLPRVG